MYAAAAAAKSLQSCPTLCDHIDGSLPGSPIPGILQARTLEWVAISFSNAWKWKVKGKSLSHVRLFATPWTAAYQAPLSMGFSRQEYWSGVPLLSQIHMYSIRQKRVVQYICIYTHTHIYIYIWHFHAFTYFLLPMHDIYISYNYYFLICNNLFGIHNSYDQYKHLFWDAKLLFLREIKS